MCLPQEATYLPSERELSWSNTLAFSPTPMISIAGVMKVFGYDSARLFDPRKQGKNHYKR